MNSKPAFLFQQMNYIIILIAVCLLTLGYILMSGGNTQEPTQFNTEIYSFQRISIAPIIIVAGYILAIYAIMHRSKK